MFLRNIKDYAIRIRLNRIQNRIKAEWDEYAISAHLPWINEENAKRLVAKIVPDDENSRETDYGQKVIFSVMQYL